MKFRETARRISSAMSMNNMNAKELSDRSGVAKASISQYTNGSHKPSNISAGKMAVVLGVDPLWLMGFDVPMRKDETSVCEITEITESEKKLLAGFRQLNEEGQEKVISYTSDLAASGRYKKHNQPEILDEEA